MTLFPRWFQYLFVAAIAAGLGIVLVMHAILSYDVNTLLGIPDGKISRLAIESNPYDPGIQLHAGNWDAIRTALAENIQSYQSGLLYKSWIPSCKLIISVKGVSIPYMLEFETRPSVDQKVLMSLHRGNPEADWQYGYYRGGTVLGVLRKIAPR